MGKPPLLAQHFGCLPAAALLSLPSDGAEQSGEAAATTGGCKVKPFEAQKWLGRREPSDTFPWRRTKARG